MVVGTTAITGKQVAFQNLGLVVVDEEQRLGVGQKEKLKVGVRVFGGWGGACTSNPPHPSMVRDPPTKNTPFATKQPPQALAKGVDVLTLSATPIPRTLQMALSGTCLHTYVDIKYRQMITDVEYKHTQRQNNPPNQRTNTPKTK